MARRAPLLTLAGAVMCGVLLAGCGTAPRWPAITQQPTAQHMPGRWVWAELFTTDVTSASRFYGDVFDWRFEALDVGGDSYSLVRSGGMPVAGVVHREKATGASTGDRWLGLMSVADVDRTAERATAAGGGVLLAPRDLPGRGRVAVLADPEGARFGVLHAQDGDPADIFPAHGTWLWRELWARNAAAMAAFYGPLVDYEVIPQSDREDVVEYHLAAAGYPRAGILEAGSDLPSTWLLYVRVPDLAETLSRVQEAGGEILIAPDPGIRQGRVALIRDPLGAALGIAQWEDAEGPDRP